MNAYTEIRKEYPRTWRIWYIMNQRCDPEWCARHLRNNTTYYEVCDDWSREVSGEQGFINFFDHLGEIEDPELQIHRLHTDRPYEPSNTIVGDVYSRCKHSKNYLTEMAQGKRRAKLKGIPSYAYYNRLNKGWSIQEASTAPYKPKWTRSK